MDLPLKSCKGQKFAGNGLHQSGGLAYNFCSKVQLSESYVEKSFKFDIMAKI